MDHIAYTEEVTTTISSNNNIVQTFETIEPKGDAIKNILVINEVRKVELNSYEIIDYVSKPIMFKNFPLNL